MKRFLFFLFLSVITLGVHSQAPSKKCPTCGLSIPKCEYHGKHPKPAANPVPKLSKSTGTINGHDYVDLGLSVKWATCNVGASSLSDYGNYYAWGETSTKAKYCWDTYKWCNGSSESFIKYCTDSKYGNIDNKTTLELSDDVANSKWGMPWRLPTEKECEELSEKCTWKWTTINGHKGNIVTGPNGNSIFLPAAGQYENAVIYGRNEGGYYWSSSLHRDTGYDAIPLSNLKHQSTVPFLRASGGQLRSTGCTIRPVTE